MFVFDLNTVKGLNGWNYYDVTDDPLLTMFRHGMFAADTRKAYLEIIGFAKDEAGHYRKFKELMFNTAFDLREVRELLERAGFAKVEFRRGDDELTPTASPEDENRAFIAAYA
jgi:hypothetical protein